MKLYKVSFQFCDDYRPKVETMVSICLVVLASDQFTALSEAWQRLGSLDLPEPESFNASRVEKAC